jgi:hypothetical protein
MKRPHRLLLSWLAAVAVTAAVPAAFVASVDPFGYFGTNTVGYYYSSERQFKQHLIRTANYNALVLGDSRIAFTNPSLIKMPAYRFLNAGIGGSSFGEQMEMLVNSKLNDLDLVVFGLTYKSLSVHGNCSEDLDAEASLWDPIRYSASWTQSWYAISALWARHTGERPYYHPDGTRDSTRQDATDATLTERQPNYWRVIFHDAIGLDRLYEERPFGIAWIDDCLRLLERAKAMSERHGFRIIIVFLPLNRDLLNQFDFKAWLSSEQSKRAFAQLRGIIPHVFNFVDSPYSHSDNFWRADPAHFKPHVGARLMEEAIKRSEKLGEN